MISQRVQQGAACSGASKRLPAAPRPGRPRQRAAVPRSPVAQDWTAPHGSNSSSRHVAYSAKQDASGEISGYTPAEFISFSTDPAQACVHAVEAEVNAPADVCFAAWDDWQRLVDFLDLIGQIGLDEKSPDMALFNCYYRWAKLPVMEILFLLQKKVTQPGRRIEFESVWGMPMSGFVELSDVEGSGGASTRVKLQFTHPMPNLLLQLRIGPLAVEGHLATILKENMEDYRQAVEGSAAAKGGGDAARPPGVLKQRAEAARREQEQRQAAAGAAAGPSGQDAAPAAAAAAAGGKQPRRSRAQTGDAAAPAAAAAAPKRRGGTSRRTAAADAGEGSAGAPPRRGRPPSRRTAAADDSGSGGGGPVEGAAAGRRGRPTSSRGGP